LGKGDFSSELPLQTPQCGISHTIRCVPWTERVLLCFQLSALMPEQRSFIHCRPVQNQHAHLFEHDCNSSRKLEPFVERFEHTQCCAFFPRGNESPNNRSHSFKFTGEAATCSPFFRPQREIPHVQVWWVGGGEMWRAMSSLCHTLSINLQEAFS
jgi:hypothetical protein